ncbi:MAG: iron ABC transporter permease [Clostridiales bacterium]|nr:iron ABC transporter permease [Clostridiales bacterium]
MSLDQSGLESKGIDPAYHRNRLRSMVCLIVLGFILLLAVLLSLWAGSYDTPIGELVLGIFNRSADEKINVVVRNVRLPRICTAAVAGAGLGVTGCILQAVLSNPLASSSTLGVSQGAGFGAAFAIIALGAGASGKGGFLVSLCAFAGSMAVAVVIFGLSKFRQVSPESIVLAGVAISSMFTGATTLLQYFADDVELAALVFWTFGDLGTSSWNEIRFMAVVVLLVCVYFLFHRWDFNALLSGTETATSLGINVRRLTMINMILCCFTSSTIVSSVGLINFIGLVAPHIVRRVVGNNHVYLIPGSILAGASLLLLGDLFARTVISPVILPIGAITSFLGAPLFLYLLFKGRKKTC